MLPLRGLLTAFDLHLWYNLSHHSFEAAMGVHGVRLGLRCDMVRVHDETAAYPEFFPWVFADRDVAQAMTIEDRRKMVVNYLQTNRRLRGLYPAGFSVEWYS